ncbi:MAG: hypothetical protein ABJB09_05275 [Verrucomicrobiota bacterium]
MQRPNLWLALVVLLLGVLFLREPRLQRSEEFFLHWLMKNSSPPRSSAPLTVVEINRDTLTEGAALAIVSRWLIWLPGILPLGMLWLLVLLAIVPARRQRPRLADSTAIPPPIP